MRLNRKTVAFGALAGASLIAALLPAEPAAAYTGAFLSWPKQAAPQSFTGTNVSVSGRSYYNFPTQVCLTVHDAVNVDIHDVDLDTCGGGIFLINVTGTVKVQNVRARNIGDGTIGSGHSNAIQLNNVWASNPNDGVADIRSFKVYGGDTEDVISVFQSGGSSVATPLVIGDIHVEHPLPPSSLAWSSGSGTCANLADAGGHDIILQNSTFLNCGAVGIQMNEPDARVIARNNVVYGEQRATSNVGLSQWTGGPTCPSACPGNSYTQNRVWWKTAAGGDNPMWLEGTYPVADVANVKQDPTINPLYLRVVLNDYRGAVMSDSPLAYWRFVTTLDETSNNHDGTLRGSPAPLLDQPGPFTGSRSVRFDGVLRGNTDTQGFLANSVARLSATTWVSGFTLEAWAKTTTSGPEQHVMTWSTSAGDAGPGTLYDDPDDRWKFRDGVVSVSQTGTTTINAWHHVVVTVDATSAGTLYVDGASVQTWNSGVDPVATATGLFTIGADYDSHNCPCPHVDTPFNGWIAEAAVYNKALTLSRVQAHYVAR